MMDKTNLAESMRQRILNESRRSKQDNGALLTRYAIERLLYRLSQSQHHDRFVLKGAALYLVWLRDEPTLQYRPTRDLDFWGSGSPSIEGLVETFKEVLQTSVEPDGLEWPLDEVRGQVMREDAEYEGARLTMLALLGRARISVQIDFGFGDAITPSTVEVAYPTLLSSSSAPRLRTYPRETVVDEKFQALVALGMANTRMKDFFDLWTLSQHFDFDGPVLRSAIEATFAHRNTRVPTEIPVALTSQFTGDTAKLAAWRAFGRRNRIDELPDLPRVTLCIERFLMPLIREAGQAKLWHRTQGWL